MSRKVKSVSFALDDPWELELYELAIKQKCFSKFVKRLIEQTKCGKVEEGRKVVPISQSTSPVVDKEYLRQLI